MKTVEDYERIRKAYYVERLSMREICRRFHHGRNVIRNALDGHFLIVGWWHLQEL